MEFKDIANIVVNSGNRIDGFWRYFTALNTIVIGWLVSFDHPITTNLRIGLFVIYIVACAINLSTLLREYLLFEKLLYELQSKIGSTSLTNSIKELVINIKFNNRVPIAVFIHISTMFIIFILIFR